MFDCLTPASIIRAKSTPRWCRSEPSGKDRFQEFLYRGQRELLRLRRVQFTVAISFAVVFSVGYLAVVSTLRTDRITCPVLWKPVMHEAFTNILHFGALVCFSLAPLADDLNGTRFVLGLDLLTMILASIETMSTNKLSYQVVGIPRVVFCIGITTLAFHPRVARMQELMWVNIQFYIVLDIVTALATAIHYLVEDCGRTRFWVAGLMKILILVFVSQRVLRDRIQTAFLSLVKSRSSQKAAAGVAALVGDCSSAEDIYREAGKRFRTICLSVLTEEHMADNTPDPALFALSTPSKLKECDAFISHSWSDDSDAKWKALQRWRADFVAEHQREARVWIDKCCIDQSNIDADLRCLPLFLWGCRRMVVLCGPTYLTRLWCIVEMFTFLHINRDLSDIEPICLSGDDTEDEDEDWLVGRLMTFDVSRCNCFSPQDKEKMLTIIRTAFSNSDAFNREVRRMFAVIAHTSSSSGSDGSNGSGGTFDAGALSDVV